METTSTQDPIDLSYPCSDCQRYTCRCGELAADAEGEQEQPPGSSPV
jgi:hypothetical protein